MTDVENMRTTDMPYAFSKPRERDIRGKTVSKDYKSFHGIFVISSSFESKLGFWPRVYSSSVSHHCV